MASNKPSFLKKVAHRLGVRALKYAGIPLRDKALIDLFGVKTNQSGVTIDEHSAETFSAYYSGVTLLANVVSMLPTAVYEESETGGYEIKPLHMGTRLFKNRSNANMTTVTMKEMLQRAAITWGDGFARIERAGGDAGPPVGLWPLSSEQVEPTYDDESGELIYKFTKKYPGEEDRIYKKHEILHVPGMGFDGLKGYSVVKLANESIGLGVATEKFGASFFGNNAIPGGIITHPGDVDERGEQNISDEWEKKNRGPYKARRVIVLDEGMKYEPVGIPPEDSQFLQTRQFQVVEIARWLRIPPHMLYDMTGATFNTTENMSLQFLIYSIQPWLVRWIQECNIKLLTEDEQEKHTFSFDVSELLQMDSKTRWDVYSTGRNMGVYTLNDILRKERLPTLAKQIGETRLAPSTMKILGQSDPFTPIDPDVMQKAYQTIKMVTDDGKNKIKWDRAKSILDSLLPSCDESTISALLFTLSDQKYVDPQQ